MSKEYEEKRGPRGADDHTEKRFPRERRAEERVPMRERDAEADGLIEGRNAVTEALRAGTPIDKIFIARGETDKTLGTSPPPPARRAWWWSRPTAASSTT